MKQNNLQYSLTQADLTKKEAQIYIAALELGPCSVLSISRKTKIKRTTVYVQFESLKEKGLLNIEYQGFKKFYVAQAPKTLTRIIEQKRKNILDIIPELEAIYNLKNSGSNLKYYEGLESVKSVYENLLKEVAPNDYYLIFSNDEQWFKADPKYFQNFIKKRSKLNIDIRTILEDSTIARKHKRLQKNYNEKIKILPHGKTLTTNLIITPQKVVIHQLSPSISAIVIETKSIIKMHKELFEIVWSSIKD